ncbi:MAG: DUF6364 family protein [Endozoicomonas sp.]
MSKLTLTVDPEVVKQAKAYAAGQQQSLSKLVENFLRTLPATPEESEKKLTGITAELAGIIDEKDLNKVQATQIIFRKNTSDPNFFLDADVILDLLTKR